LNGASGTVGVAGTRNDAPTATAGTSSNIIDLGIVGIPASISGGGGGGARDIGIGDKPSMKFLVQVVVAFVTGTSLQVGVQGAPDNGSGAAGTFTTMLNGPVVAVANLVAGARILDDDMPRPVPAQAMPRFLQLLYTVVGSSFTVGQLTGFLVLDRMDIPEQSNAVMGGYPPGITIAN
jgi:hypothetical protein